MKKVISILSILLIMFLCLGCLTGCEDKNKENGEENNTASSEYKWPDLTMYNIPNMEKGKITALTESEGQDDYVFKYDVELTSVTKDDIDAFCNSFEDWTITEGEQNIYIVKSDRINRYSVVIKFDEENNKAKITMTAMQ